MFWSVSLCLQLLLCTELYQYGSLALIQGPYRKLFDFLFVFFPCFSHVKMSSTQSFPKYHKFCSVSYETQQELGTTQMDVMCVLPVLKPNCNSGAGQPQGSSCIQRGGLV